MKIESISLSVLEVQSNTNRFDLRQAGTGLRRRWLRQYATSAVGEIHLLHVLTDEGIEGVCTVGDARYTTMRPDELEQLRMMAVGHDPLDREYLFAKLHKATRSMFSKPGWFGAFDNCLWDIAGKAANMPVYALMGRARPSCPAYYNIGGIMDEQAWIVAERDIEKALDAGFGALKDHFQDTAARNIQLFEKVRARVGPSIELLHDSAMAGYSYADALKVGRALEALDFGWFEEPLPDAEQQQLQNLCRALDIPIVAPESLMHDMQLSAQWLISGATDLLRANGRHGATAMLKLAHLAELHGSTIEFNGPGGLFGLVHAHLVCAISNTSYYEYFPGGSRDEAGKEIGLLNPPLPHNGEITPPAVPGWGAEWDWGYVDKKRVAKL